MECLSSLKALVDLDFMSVFSGKVIIIVKLCPQQNGTTRVECISLPHQSYHCFSFKKNQEVENIGHASLAVCMCHFVSAYIGHAMFP